jgi:hypothetical protein
MEPAAGEPRAAAPASVQADGWDFVGSLPTYGDTAYVLIAPTLADSNATGVHRATFFVRAATAAPTVYYDSPADSGYTVDNLPPAPPAPFAATYSAGATRLHWSPNVERDLASYRLYRGNASGFVPAPGNLVATLADTGYADPGPGGASYKLSAVDVNGNESGFASLSSENTAGIVDAGGPGFALGLAGVNPVVGGRLVVAFTLWRDAPARLEVLDVSGRRVASRDVGRLGPGRHVLDLSSARRLGPGLYLVRLEQDGMVRVTRAAVLD